MEDFIRMVNKLGGNGSGGEERSAAFLRGAYGSPSAGEGNRALSTCPEAGTAAGAGGAAAPTNVGADALDRRSPTIPQFDGCGDRRPGDVSDDDDNDNSGVAAAAGHPPAPTPSSSTALSTSKSKTTTKKSRPRKNDSGKNDSEPSDHGPVPDDSQSRIDKYCVPSVTSDAHITTGTEPPILNSAGSDVGECPPVQDSRNCEPTAPSTQEKTTPTKRRGRPPKSLADGPTAPKKPRKTAALKLKTSSGLTENPEPDMSTELELLTENWPMLQPSSADGPTEELIDLNFFVTKRSKRFGATPKDLDPPNVQACVFKHPAIRGVSNSSYL